MYVCSARNSFGAEGYGWFYCGGLPVAIWVLDGKVISFPSFLLFSLAPPYLGGVWGASHG